MSNVQYFETNAKLSKAVICNGMLFLSGMTSDAAPDYAGQAKIVLEKINAYLEKYGSDKRHLLSATIHLSSMEGFAAFNEAWDAWLDADCRPTRTCVEAKLARAALLVEVTVIAALVEGKQIHADR